VKRLSSWALPILLGVAGVALIIIGSLDLGGTPSESLPPIATATPVAQASATPTDGPTPGGEASETADPTPEPTQTPLPSDVVAVQLQVESVGINVRVRQSDGPDTDGFPPSDSAFILSQGSQPGRNTNSYIFAHAINTLFKPLWNVQPGAEILVRMSNDAVLRYVITEIRPNIACPDENANPSLNPEAFGVELPLVLQLATDCSEGQRWTAATDYERLTLQTSQGYNRNWGELVIIADPAP
jgi:hypothetical protein